MPYISNLSRYCIKSFLTYDAIYKKHIPALYLVGKYEQMLHIKNISYLIYRIKKTQFLTYSY